jgi:Universal stress protein family
MKQTVKTSKESFADESSVPKRLDFGQILVPTDFSRKSRAAVDYAIELARLFGAQVTLVPRCPRTVGV